MEQFYSKLPSGPRAKWLRRLLSLTVILSTAAAWASGSSDLYFAFGDDYVVRDTEFNKVGGIEHKKHYVRIKIPAAATVRDESGNIDLDLSLKELYDSLGSSYNELNYIPVEVVPFTGGTSLKGMLALEYAVNKGDANAVSKEYIESQIEGAITSTEPPARFDPESTLISKAFRTGCYLKNFAEETIKDITDGMMSRMSLFHRCPLNPDANGFNRIYSSEFFRALNINRRASAQDVYNKCTNAMQMRACETDQFIDLDLKERSAQLLSMAEPFAIESGVSPYAYPCIAVKETTFISPSRRTECSCTEFPPAKTSTNCTAVGLFHLTKRTIGLYLEKGYFRITDPGDERLWHLDGQNHIIEALKLALGPNADRMLNDAVTNFNGGEECSDKPACKNLKEKLYNLMGGNINLQLALASAILRELDYEVYKWYDPKQPNHPYARRVNSCINCMASGKDRELCLAKAYSGKAEIRSKQTEVVRELKTGFDSYKKLCDGVVEACKD